MPPNKSRIIAINLISMHMHAVHLGRANLETVFHFREKLGFLTMELCSILMHIESFLKTIVSSLVQILYLSKCSVSLTISKLVRKNLLIKKQPDAYEDNRKTYFYLTPNAQALLQSAQNNLMTTSRYLL